MSKELSPHIEETIVELDGQVPTPYYLYDQLSIEETAQGLNDAFAWVDGYSEHPYRNFYAVKALPNPYVLEALHAQGMGADASSGPEIELAKAVGMRGGEIMFTSNNTPEEEYQEAHEAGAIINLDDVNQIDTILRALDGEFPETISFRFNPGSEKTSGTNEIIGEADDAKFGVPLDQLPKAYNRAIELGATRFGLHTMVASNELDIEAHVERARLAFDQAMRIHKMLGIDFDFINLGGGLGIPYQPDQEPLDVEELGKRIEAVYRSFFEFGTAKPPQVVTEYGRYVTGPHGYLVTRARSIKEGKHRHVGVDASMANLMRPGMYDAYHHISVAGGVAGELVVQRVVGGLCENNDHFTGKDTKERKMEPIEPGELVVIHDAGAHAHSMGFNYNGKLRSSEHMLRPDGRIDQIRRAETREDLFATLDYPNL